MVIEANGGWAGKFGAIFQILIDEAQAACGQSRAFIDHT
jgi:hypothetical protein